MAITATRSNAKEFKKVPPGCHFAICNMVVDLGVQETSYKGQTKSQHKVYFRWEVPDERITYERDGVMVEGPCSIGATYTLSLSDKANLRKILENWRGKPFTEAELDAFDITTVAGKPCQVMVQHETVNGKTYANVTGVMGISREQRERARTAKSEVGVLVYELEAPDPEVYERLPNWIKEKLETRVSAQPKAAATTVLAGGDELNDDIPF